MCIFLIKKFNYTKYLEIGIAGGECFRFIEAAYKVSVDPAEDRYAHANPTFKMTSDDFFKQNHEIFDIIFTLIRI